MYISFITFILLFVVCIYVHYFFDVVRKPTQQLFTRVGRCLRVYFHTRVSSLWF